MATLNYTKRLENLQNRRFDKDLKESLISKSFSEKTIPDNIKYLMESMRPIDYKYNEKTLEAADRVQNHLQAKFQLHFNRVYKKQGSIMTKTNIKVHSDIDLLTIINKYFYPESTPTIPYTASDPDEDIIELRKQIIEILKDIYDEVDDSGAKSISIFNKSLNRKIDIVPCFWYNSSKYEETQNEYYRGVYLYDFNSKTKKRDFPFATINQVNYKGDTTMDGSRRGIRLLKTLKADNEDINLSSFHLTTLVHKIENSVIRFSPGSELQIARSISSEMSNIIQNPTYSKSIECPIGIETPFTEEKTITELKKLKDDLDVLIEDSSKEILSSNVIQKAILTY